MSNLQMLNTALIMSPLELLTVLLTCQYSLNDSTYQVKRYYPDTTTDQMCKIIKEQASEQVFTRSEVEAALTACGYPKNEIEVALDQYYPPSKYGVKLQNGSFLYAYNQSEYAFGTENFTVEALVLNPISGSLISKKESAGGYKNGGFLVVINGDHTIKFALDNGYGYREVITKAPVKFDTEAWTHILCTRMNNQLKIYVNFVEVAVLERGNISNPVNITNNARLTIGYVDQYQEPYRTYQGGIADIRIWKEAIYYLSKTDYVNRIPKKEDASLVGWWNFEKKSYADQSSVSNTLNQNNTPELIPCSF